MRTLVERLFILDGKQPMRVKTERQWSEWMFDRRDRHVAETTIGEVWISTVFLGLDHNYHDIGEPILFETMCFVDGESADTLMFARYCTWEDAEAGHAAAVAVVRAMHDIGETRADQLMNRLRGQSARLRTEPPEPKT